MRKRIIVDPAAVNMELDFASDELYSSTEDKDSIRPPVRGSQTQTRDWG